MGKNKESRFKIFCKPFNIPFKVAEDKVKDFERHSNDYTYAVSMRKEDVDKIPTMSKKTIQECKDYLKKMEIVDTNSKEYIETQAYNKFADLMLGLYKGDIVNEMNCPVRIIRQNIKDIRDQLIEELTKRKED